MTAHSIHNILIILNQLLTLNKKFYQNFLFLTLQFKINELEVIIFKNALLE